MNQSLRLPVEICFTPYNTSKNLYKMVIEQRKKSLSKEKYEENIRDRRDMIGMVSRKKLIAFSDSGII